MYTYCREFSYEYNYNATIVRDRVYHAFGHRLIGRGRPITEITPELSDLKP